MVLIIGIAGAAALAVLLYNHLREQQPELATLSTRRAQQLAAVVLVEALALGLRLGGHTDQQYPVAATTPGGQRRLGRRVQVKRTSLKVVVGSRYRVQPEPRMIVATQAIFAGPQVSPFGP